MGVVVAILADGTEVLAEYDGCEWLVHRDHNPGAQILSGDQMVDWKPVE